MSWRPAPVGAARASPAPVAWTGASGAKPAPKCTRTAQYD